MSDLLTPPGKNFIEENFLNVVHEEMNNYQPGYGINEGSINLITTIHLKKIYPVGKLENTSVYTRKEWQLVYDMSAYLSFIRIRLRIIWFIYSQVRTISKIDLENLPNEHIFFLIAKHVNEMSILWNSQKSVDTKQHINRVRGIRAKFFAIRSFIDKEYQEILKFRMDWAIEVVTLGKGQFNKVSQVMSLKARLPMLEHQRYVDYQFHQNGNYSEFRLEKNLLHQFNLKMNEVIELLNKVPNKEDKVFNDLSAEVQKTYDLWIHPPYFNSHSRNYRYVREEKIEELTTIINFVKSETQKYNEALIEAEKEKKEILKEVEVEKKQELEAEIELQKRNTALKKEDVQIQKITEEKLKEQLNLIDKHFEEASLQIETKNKKEIEELIAIYGPPQQNIQVNQVSRTTPNTGNQNVHQLQKIQSSIPRKESYYKKNWLEEILGRRI